jgi:hypothetical protein
MAVKNSLVSDVDALCYPKSVVVRINLTAYTYPLIDRETLLPPEKNNRLTLIAQIGRMLDVCVQQSGQGAGHCSVIPKEGAGDLKIYGCLKPLSLGCIQQSSKICLSRIL